MIDPKALHDVMTEAGQHGQLDEMIGDGLARAALAGAAALVSRWDQEDCDACRLAADDGGDACLYHEGAMNGYMSMSDAVQCVLDDPEIVPARAILELRERRTVENQMRQAHDLRGWVAALQADLSGSPQADTSNEETTNER